LICGTCGTENAAGKKFCVQCGAPLTLACASCGSPLAAGERFCGECGTPVAEPRPAAAQPAVPISAPSSVETPSAERRLVSVLFADLVGFTTLSESRDSEEVRDLLSKYFDTCRTLIARYGGTVEKFIGDAVMAVWGAPVATEDDAERAVRAALDLTAAVATMGAGAGPPVLRARAGVLTGEAAVNVGASGEGMVAGDMVNTASRIQSAAPPGGVFVGEATHRATEATIAYEDAGAFELKGKAGLVTLWRAQRLIAGARGTLRAQGLEAPFVGRDRELRMAKDLYHASTDEKKAHLLSVIGIAGIGKSRMVWEFYKYFDGLVDDAFWHRGRCLSYGEGVTYWALAEMVRMRARIAEEEEPASALEKLRATVRENVPDLEEQRWIEPRLAHLLGLEDRTAADREDLFAAWRLFFERLADQFPTILVFEDMQWADPSLLDFIEYLLEWSRNFPLYIVTLARPEFADRRPNWGSGKRNFTSLYLESLEPEAMHELMAGLVPGLPAELEERILSRAEGVPLYAVETVRMLLDRGLLVQEGNVYRPTGPIESLEVPETLHALIAARLDGLTAEERRVVQDASVLGKTFFKQAVAEVGGVAQEEIEPILTGLVRKEILTVQADPRSPERGQYGFLQDLVKKIAYDTISKKDRKAKHLSAAAFIERTFAADEDEIVEVLAAHYLSAFGAAPDAEDAGTIKEKAIDLLARAGERAASLAASAEALHYFEQAIELTDDPLRRAELHERAGKMAWKAGHAAAATAHDEEAIAGFESIGLTHPAARVSAALAEIVWQSGHIEEAVERMEAAYAVLSQEEQDADVAWLAAQLGRLLYFMGRTDEALERIEFALDIAEGLRLPEVMSQAMNTKGLILSTRGRFEEGIILLRRALEIALEHDLTAATVRAYNNLGAAASQVDRFEEVLEIGRQGLELARRTGDHMWEVSFMTGDIGELMYLGRWDEAVERLGLVDLQDEAVVDIVRTGLSPLVALFVHRGESERAGEVLALMTDMERSQDVQVRAVYRVAHAPLLRAEGRNGEALAAAEEAFATRTEFGVRASHVKEALVEAVEAAFALGDLGKVEELLGVIEALRPGELTPYVQAQGARFGARLAAARGEIERVEAGFDAAARQFGDLSMPFARSVTMLEHAEWLITQDRAVEAEPLLEQARATFEQLKASPWLERLGRMAPDVVAEART
jgi:class 3 adenylate cyclase/tetratricopeptide (TPR) repeat protein